MCSGIFRNQIFVILALRPQFNTGTNVKVVNLFSVQFTLVFGGLVQEFINTDIHTSDSFVERGKNQFRIRIRIVYW